MRAQTVHGVLWRITSRDRVMLDSWENVGGGLYRAEVLAVRSKRCLAPSLVYFARPGAAGRPKPGYIELVVAALQNQQGYISQPDRMTPGSSVGGSLAGRWELSSTTSEKLTVATR